MRRSARAVSSTARAWHVFTDEHGQFQLPLEPAQRSAQVQARKSGWSASELVELELVPGRPPPFLELHLTKGGAVRGRLVELDGVDPEQVDVRLLSAEDGPLTPEVDARGHFFVHHLRPGRWTARVGRPLPPLRQRRHGDLATALADEQEHGVSFDVLEDDLIDLPLAVPAHPVELHGRLLVDGEAPGDWTWRLDRRDAEAFDAQGRFHTTLEKAGEHTLMLHQGIFGVLRFPLVLHEGENHWEYELATARLHVTCDDPAALDDLRVMVTLDWNDPASGASWYCSESAWGEGGTLRLPHVPAGSVRLWTRALEVTREVDLARPDLELELLAGEELEVVLERAELER